VIDGARWKEDVAYFRDRFGDRVIHLHLSAPTEVRKRRFEAREKDVSFEVANSGEVESEVPLLAPSADSTFQNDTDDAEKLMGFLDIALGGAGSAR
jgi:adenylosuccinate synthase